MVGVVAYATLAGGIFMGEVVRFGVSLERELLQKFDARNRRKGYSNRSEAIRDLVRQCLVEEEWSKREGETLAVVSIVYDHDKVTLARTLAQTQHKRHRLIIATTHVHLDEHNCLEVLILRGKASQVKQLGEEIVAKRGVKHGRFFMTTTGKGLV